MRFHLAVAGFAVLLPLASCRTEQRAMPSISDRPFGRLPDSTEVRLFTLDNGRQVRIATDASWLGSADAPAGWQQTAFDDTAWKQGLIALASGPHNYTCLRAPQRAFHFQT